MQVRYYVPKRKNPVIIFRAQNYSPFQSLTQPQATRRENQQHYQNHLIIQSDHNYLKRASSQNTIKPKQNAVIKEYSVF